MTVSFRGKKIQQRNRLSATPCNSAHHAECSNYLDTFQGKRMRQSWTLAAAVGKRACPREAVWARKELRKLQFDGLGWLATACDGRLATAKIRREPTTQTIGAELRGCQRNTPREQRISSIVHKTVYKDKTDCAARAHFVGVSDACGVMPKQFSRSDDHTSRRDREPRRRSCLCRRNQAWPVQICRIPEPNLPILAGPMPAMARSSSSECGCSSAMARRVLSEKTQKAGWPSFCASALRQARRRVSSAGGFAGQLRRSRRGMPVALGAAWCAAGAFSLLCGALSIFRRAAVQLAQQHSIRVAVGEGCALVRQAGLTVRDSAAILLETGLVKPHEPGGGEPRPAALQTGREGRGFSRTARHAACRSKWSGHRSLSRRARPQCRGRGSARCHRAVARSAPWPRRARTHRRGRSHFGHSRYRRNAGPAGSCGTRPTPQSAPRGPSGRREWLLCAT